MNAERGVVSSSGHDSAAGASDGVIEPIISVDGLRKSYGDGDTAVDAVKGVDFAIRPGGVIGILGPNGAGKTTLIKMILGLIVPTEGTVEVDGVDVHENTTTAHEKMGAMLEGARNSYWRLSVRENLEMFSVIGGNDYRNQQQRIETLLAQFNLDEKADTAVRELSRGQKQKVSLLCTLVRNTDVVFLDEPTLGLDVESGRELQREIRRLSEADGRTVIILSHDMRLIRSLCDRVMIMNDGAVVEDNTVDNLVEIFDANVYEVTVTGELDRETEAAIESVFTLVGVERGEKTTIHVELSRDEFYQFTRTLERSGLLVDSFDAQEVEFDDIFLRLTDGASDTERLGGSNE